VRGRQREEVVAGVGGMAAIWAGIIGRVARREDRGEGVEKITVRFSLSLRLVTPSLINQHFRLSLIN
jgi:hypothetical protein